MFNCKSLCLVYLNIRFKGFSSIAQWKKEHRDVIYHSLETFSENNVVSKSKLTFLNSLSENNDIMILTQKILRSGVTKSYPLPD